MKRQTVTGILIASALVLGGCGEQMIELTPEEEGIIVNYSAHIISKYNVTQPEGYRFVFESPEEPEEEAVEEETQEEQESEAGASGEASSENDASEAPDVFNDDGSSEGESEDGGDDEKPEISAAEAFANALGMEGAGLVYTGAEFTNLYETVYPDAGNEIMALHFSLENMTEEPFNVNILDLSPVFRASLNGADAVTADITLLSSDLSTFAGTLEPGEPRDMVLLFQVPEGTSHEVESLIMQLIAGGRTTKIILR